MNDHYKVLGVSMKASAAEIKRAYQAALSSSAAKSKDVESDIREAYRVLTDIKVRKNYDIAMGFDVSPEQKSGALKKCFYFVFNFTFGFSVGLLGIGIPLRFTRHLDLPTWLYVLIVPVFIIPIWLGVAAGLKGEKFWRELLSHR